MSINHQASQEKPNSVQSPETSGEGTTEQDRATGGPTERQAGTSTTATTGTIEAEAVNPQEAALAEMGAMKVYHRGDLVEGTIVQVGDDSLIIDIGTKTEGIIKREEISIGPNPDMSEFSVGDGISAVVIAEEDEEGQYQLSKRRADQRLVWDIVDISFTKGARIQATGFRAVKGGLLVDIGTIAFLPQSLMDICRVDDLEPFVGEKFEVKVVEYEREAKPHPKIVVSRRAVMEEDLTRERDGLYDSLSVNSVVDGRVVKLTNYGAFVDVGGLQGLLHISEMSLGRIKHPNDVMKEGDTIKVKILKVDKKRKRISLGRRELLPNPWENIHERYKPGMVVQGVVVRTADFGAFIRLDDYFEGLAHISELVDNKISHAKEVFNQGDKVSVLVMNVDRKNRRIKLSVRRAADAQRRTEVAEFMRSQGDLQNVFAAQLQAALQESELEFPSVGEAPAESEPVQETSEPAPTVQEAPIESAAEPVSPEPVQEISEPAPTVQESPVESAGETVSPEPECTEPERTSSEMNGTPID